MTALRILYTNFHQHNGGGHDTYITALAKGFSLSHTVIVAAPDTSRLYNTLKGDIHCLPMDYKLRFDKMVEFLKNVKQMQQWIDQYQFDIVHANGSNDHKMLILATRIARHKPKLIFTKHNSLPIKLGSKLRLQYFTDGIIAVSQFTRTQIIEAISTHIPIAVIPNGIDTDYYKPNPKLSKQALRVQYGLTEQDFVFVSVAGTSSYKGWFFLVEAVSKLPPALRERIKIVIAGVTPNEADYQQWITPFGMQSKLIFTGLLSDVREIIALGDVGFVLSYEVETISFACREMMAMGLPVLVSDYAGLPENITAEHDGWITPTKDIPALMHCVEKIVQTEQLAEMGQHSYQKAQTHFGQDCFLNDTLHFYRHILG